MREEGGAPDAQMPFMIADAGFAVFHSLLPSISTGVAVGFLSLLPGETSIERLGIAETLLVVRRASAVEADEAGIVDERFDLLDVDLLCEHAQMAAVISLAFNRFTHG
jgi:hypothetical protein